MALLFLSPDDPADLWRAELQARIPGLDVRIWPELGDPAEIDLALVCGRRRANWRATRTSGRSCRSLPASTA